jgi:rhodanese-related sulfurtransferase
MNVEQIIKEKQGTVVDVRTPEEFRGVIHPDFKAKVTSSIIF